jgi:hypothetical protein
MEIKLGVVLHTCNPRYWKQKDIEFEASQGKVNQTLFQKKKRRLVVGGSGSIIQV